MDDTPIVRGFEGLGDLQSDAECFVHGHEPWFDALGQCLTGDELHDQEARR
jgi:hypothetical protein